MGYADQAMTQSRELLRLAAELDHPSTMALARFFIGLIQQVVRNVPAAGEHAQAVVDIGVQHKILPYLNMGKVLQGWVMAHQGMSDQGLDQINDVLEPLLAKQRRVVLLPCFLGLLGEIYLLRQEPQHGKHIIEEALKIVEMSGERLWQAELHRLHGALLMLESSNNQHEATICYRQALQTARRQGRDGPLLCRPHPSAGGRLAGDGDGGGRRPLCRRTGPPHRLSVRPRAAAP